MKKNVVVIGYGGQGAWHADHALKSDVVALLGVYDIREERNQLARSRGIRVYSSLDEICAVSGVCVVGGRDTIDACDMLDTVEALQ